jgi:hypothetical protein
LRLFAAPKCKAVKKRFLFLRPSAVKFGRKNKKSTLSRGFLPVSLSLADNFACAAEDHVVNVADELVRHIGYHSPFSLHFTVSV